MPNLSKLKSRLNIAAAVLALSSLNMEGGLDHLKAPFLSSNNNGELSEVTRLKCDFFSKLPDKVRCGLDPELSFHIDYSKATGLTKGEKEYYERQFATLRSFEEVDSTESSNVIEDGSVDAEQVQSERAMKISNWANVFLLAFKGELLSHLQETGDESKEIVPNRVSPSPSSWVPNFHILVFCSTLTKNHTLLVFATVKSGSIAIAASTLDSLLDLMAGEYPIGKLRMQPVGITIFAAIMATLGFQVLVEAVQQLIKGKPTLKMTSDQLFWLYIIMLIATGDHYFDVITNIVGLVAAVLGDKFSWWIDPIGAILLALYTISNWSKTVLENVVSLVGQSAPPEVLQKLTYLVLRYHPQITRIDTVRAYTCGVLYFVEVDIELPEDLPLKEAHAIGESLQIRIEELPEVERAFVHLDTECEHKPEHSVLSTLPSSQI
ncbi:Metal tolerance protein 4 [Glycine max]|nr:Metal tolerance protein 4 [Glycine max]